jgi:glycosyltransferase involved in cell wall biosynthesis
MRILRLADVTGSPEGGMAGVMIHGGAALERLGHQVEYAFRGDLGSFPTSGPGRRLVGPLLAVREVLRRRRDGRHYDVVEIHEPLAAAYCALRKPLRLPPCVVLSHGLEARGWEAQQERWAHSGSRPSFKSRIAIPLTLLSQARYALRHANQVVVPTEEDREYLLENLGIPPRRVSRVDNGASPMLRRIVKPGTATKRPNTLAVLFFGSWIDRKGIGELTEATSLLAARGIRFRLTAAGGNVPADQIMSSFPAHVMDLVTVRTRVPRDEIPSLLAEHDVLVSPSWFEGMPLTVLEAAAGGLALILSDISGHRQILRAADGDRPSALVVPCHDPEALAAAIIQLSEDPELLDQLRKEAPAIAERLTWAHTAEQLQAAYLLATR